MPPTVPPTSSSRPPKPSQESWASSTKPNSRSKTTSSTSATKPEPSPPHRRLLNGTIIPTAEDLGDSFSSERNTSRKTSNPPQHGAQCAALRLPHRNRGFFTAGSPPVTPPLRRASCRPPLPRSPLQGELPKAEGVPPPPHSVRCHGKTPTQDRNAECKTPSQHHLTLW